MGLFVLVGRGWQFPRSFILQLTIRGDDRDGGERASAPRCRERGGGCGAGRPGGAARVSQDVVCRSLRGDASRFHDHAEIGRVFHHSQIVRGDDHRGVRFRRIPAENRSSDSARSDRAPRSVRRGGAPRARGSGRKRGRPALLSTRQTMGRAVAQLLDSESDQRLLNPFPDARRRPAELQRSERQLVVHGRVEQLHVGILEDQADPVAGTRRRRRRRPWRPR